MAADMPGKTIFSVESDKAWCDTMQDWFDANPPASPVHLHHADVGKTGKKAEVLAFIDQIWTDMRPLSLQKHMAQSP